MVERRTALVTGVAGGLGRAIAACFQQAGWFVIGIDRRASEEPPKVDRLVIADLGKGGVERLVAELDDLPDLDALVNNAAVQVNKPLVETTDDEWEEVISTNLGVAFRLIRDLHPFLAKSRGAIVNIGSVHAVATSPNVAAYAISKGALATLTRTAALELAGDGIRCNAVLPGAVMTDMLRDGLGRRPHPEGPSGNLAQLTARTPLGFVAGPAQIAPTVLHLADSSASPYTTGQLLIVDGGATLRLGTE